MKKESSESQQRLLRKLFRNNKPQLPVMNVPGTRKATLPFPVGKRTTRSETLRTKNATHTKTDNEIIAESSDSQSESKNVVHSKSSSQMEASEGAEEKSKRPRKKRISRALFRHDAIDYIKPKKQELLQKSFSLGFKKLVDKSKEIILKNDDNEIEDKTKEKDCETDNNINKVLSPNNSETKATNTRNMEHLLLDMPSLDSPCSSESTEHNNTGKILKTQTTEAHIQSNNSQNLLYRFYGIIPNKPSTLEQNNNEQVQKYNINIVPNTLNANENDKRSVPPNTSKEIAVNHNYELRNQFLYPRFPYFHPNTYGYYGFPLLTQRFPQNNKTDNKINCTIVKENSGQNYNSQIPVVQNIQHRYNKQKRSSEIQENNNNNKRICVNNDSQPTISNKNEETNEQTVIVSPKSKTCSVIKKISTNKIQHTIENILAVKPNKEVNNNHKINITNIEIIAQNDSRYHQQKSVIISPKTDETKNIKMPKLIKIPQEFHKSTNKGTKAQNKPPHCDLVSKVNQECLEQLPLNLSLKNTEERQPVIVNNTQNDPLNVDILTLVKDDNEYNRYLKLLEEKNATGPYLFYKFIFSVRKKNNQPMFDLLTFFVLLKQGKLVDYKNMYNNSFSK